MDFHVKAKNIMFLNECKIWRRRTKIGYYIRHGGQKLTSKWRSKKNIQQEKDKDTITEASR